MENKFLSFEQRGDIGLLTFNRPPVNALNPELIRELGRTLGEIRGLPLKALVLTGAGKAFIAGADISAMQNLSAGEASAFAAEGQAMLNQLEGLPFPTLAAVNGFALGGGCEVAMACDLILASERAVFGQPEVKIGVIPGFGGTQRLVRLVGIQRARELTFTGRTVPASEAVQIGLALSVHADVLNAALELAGVIAAQSPNAVRLAKQAMTHADLADGLAREQGLFGLCFASADQREGMTAFLEKRAPQFRGQP